VTTSGPTSFFNSLHACAAKLEPVLLGLHHVTALAGDPQRNLEFYRNFLGLRLVKRTVNFDDPATHHFYFADPAASPGSILTFFPWPTAPKGVRGAGQAAGASFAVPRDSLPNWLEKARDAGVEVSEPETRFGEPLITLRDAERFPVELIANGDGGAMSLHSATLAEADPDRTGAFLTKTLDATAVSNEDGRARYQIGDAWVDVVAAADRGKLGSGVVHHIAFRVAGEQAQNDWREKLTSAGIRVTRVMDRKYFRSIYFREPGGVLFEIATMAPGFTVDEALDRLGSGLMLPPWLEGIRESIERRLPAVDFEETAWPARK
jgi:glyoxalase family protein